jgi:hypothetical protein
MRRLNNVRLSMEEVQKQYKSTKKLYEQGLTVAPVDVKRVLDLYDTIEALQQENEQLRAQVAKLQEVLRGIEKEYVNDFTDEELDEELCSRDNAILNYWVRPVLNYGTVDYHNPADVEALWKTREAIQRAKENFEPYGEYEYDVRYDLEEALAEIDKAIGGKEE